MQPNIDLEERERTASIELKRIINRSRALARQPSNPVADAIEACAYNGRVNYKRLIHFLESLKDALTEHGVAIYTRGVICFASWSFLNCVAAAMLINFAFSLPITLITLQGVMTNYNGILELLSVGGCMQRNATYMRKEEPQNGH